MAGASGRRHAGRVALITGASRGIGAGIAMRLAAEGAAVAINCARGREAALALAARIEREGGRAVVCLADVGVPAAVDRTFDEVEQELGPIGILVNNAGIHRGGRLHKLDPGDFDAVVRTSLHGTYNCTRRALPGMLAAGWGRVVTISSPVARRGFPGDGAYAAAKAGQIALTRCVALEVARKGVTANVVIPGFVRTDLVGGLSEQVIAGIAASIPVGRDGRPADVAAAVSFLAGDEAAYATGTVLAVDGGLGA